MPSESDLSSLRAEIDRIDDAILDLLIERLAVVARIAAAKGDRAEGRLALRPAREAAILRRLLARAAGRFPAATLVRMWRELLAATVAQQTPLTLAVWAPPGRERVWDLARDQFGASTPAVRCEDPRRLLQAVAAGAAAIAVLPSPLPGEDWWLELLEPAAANLAPIARLPFVAGAGPEALAFAALEPEPSGEDRALLVLEPAAPGEEAALVAALAEAALSPRRLACATHRGRHLELVEIAGFRPRGDGFLAAAPPAVRRRLRAATVLGAYPRPLEPAPPRCAAADPPLDRAPSKR
ncbi:MAG: chorismate mutase [Geminicoccaceae bacterium]|nr:chorismate mutase [Geminicoccaceae bacterium]